MWALTETHRSIYAELNTAGNLCCLNPSDPPALSRCSPLAPSFGCHGPACLLPNHGPKGPSTGTSMRSVFIYFSGKKQNLHTNTRLSSASFFYDFLEIRFLYLHLCTFLTSFFKIPRYSKGTQHLPHSPTFLLRLNI